VTFPESDEMTDWAHFAFSSQNPFAPAEMTTSVVRISNFWIFWVASWGWWMDRVKLPLCSGTASLDGVSRR
jgi:hypothetical protein